VREKNLFTVIVRQEVVVAASSIEEAATVVEEAIQRGELSFEDAWILPEPTVVLPPNWTLATKVFADLEEDVKPVGDWMQAGAAPELEASLRRDAELIQASPASCLDALRKAALS
jgi:hypothetical protein